MAKMNAKQTLQKVCDYVAPKLSSEEVSELIEIMRADADPETETAKRDPVAEDTAYKNNFPHADRLKPGTRAGVCPPTVRTSPIVVGKAPSAELFPNANRLKA